MEQVRVDNVRSEATDLRPQRAGKVGVEMMACGSGHGVHPVLPEGVDEISAAPRRRHQHANCDPLIPKGRKKAEQVSFTAPYPFDLLDMKNAHRLSSDGVATD